MCGIVGLYLYDRPVHREDIDAMNATIVHRGPDDDGVLVDGCVGLGMRRLSIIDLAGGRQPIANETGRIHVIQNGELYNYRQLRCQLEALGHRFRTASDTEVALHAYEEWGGADFPKHLRGMFAIAIWDAGRQELWLARDRIGIKPLYFFAGVTGFAFGSETKVLLASPLVHCRLEPQAIAEYLTYGSAGLEGSFIKGVRQLHPGCTLRFSDGRTQIQPYWEFRFPEVPLQVGEREARELLRERFRETVRLHLVADVPVGAFLSGGVDSSAVVGMMATEGSSRLKTFSIGFGEEGFNELPFAQKVADKWQTEHHTAIVRPDDALGILDRLLVHLDEPFADASAIPTWYVSQLAASEVKVVLSGDGGDELFGGYTRYARAGRHSWIDRVPMLARRLGSSLAQLLPEWSPGKYFLDCMARDAPRGRYAYEYTLFPSVLQRRLLRPEWHPEALGVEDPLSEPLRIMEGSRAPDPISEYMYLDTLRYLPRDILVKVDRMTMAHSLEARPPLLDHEFIEFAASLPIGMKYSANGRQKHIFKEATASLVPEGLQDRRKAGFSVPLQAWFSGPLAPLFRDQVLSNGYSGEYLEPSIIRMLFEENRRGRRDHGLQLWAIMVLELWLRRNIHSG